MRKNGLKAYIELSDFRGQEGYVCSINGGMAWFFPLNDGSVSSDMIVEIKKLYVLGYEVVWR